MELTQEQVLAQLKTRGFETGGFRPVFTHIRGKLDTITGSMVQRGSMPQPRMEVAYHFSEVEVLASTEPYPFPIADITMMHSVRDKSGMGVLGNSIDKVINAGVDPNLPAEQVRNQDFLIGKTQEWKLTPGHMMWNRDEGKETPRECWEVIWVEGVGGAPSSGVASISSTAATIEPTTSPRQVAIGLLNGLTQQDWNNKVFQSSVVKNDTELTNSIIKGTFLAPLLESGEVTKDENGIFTVGEVPF